MSVFRKLWREGSDPAPDHWVERTLEALDPTHEDPGYWEGFRRALLASATPELARRRRLADVTMSDVVLGWSRALVPAAVMAAALALFLVSRPGADGGPAPMLLEDLLREGLEAAWDPTVEVEVRFSSEIF